MNTLASDEIEEVSGSGVRVELLSDLVLGGMTGGLSPAELRDRAIAAAKERGTFCP